MILLTILIIAFIALAIFVLATIGISAVAFLIPFADVIVCTLIIVLIVKCFKRKKN